MLEVRGEGEGPQPLLRQPNGFTANPAAFDAPVRHGGSLSLGTPPPQFTKLDALLRESGHEAQQRGQHALFDAIRALRLGIRGELVTLAEAA